MASAHPSNLADLARAPLLIFPAITAFISLRFWRWLPQSAAICSRASSLFTRVSYLFHKVH
eukprot:5453134-Pyramimonas_sp.AAC.1